MKADGKLLRRRRLELGLSLGAVCANTRLDISNLSKLERNLIGAHPSTLKVLADFLDLPMTKVIVELQEADAA